MLGKKVHLQALGARDAGLDERPGEAARAGVRREPGLTDDEAPPAARAAAPPGGTGGTPIVAIVGRPNVGKSTLFNRLARARIAIVHDEPGVTRDRKYADTTAFGRPYTVVDTGGFDPEDVDPMKAGIADHVRAAIAEADAIVFVTDATTGPNDADRAAVKLLRESEQARLLRGEQGRLARAPTPRRSSSTGSASRRSSP